MLPPDVPVYVAAEPWNGQASLSQRTLAHRRRGRGAAGTAAGICWPYRAGTQCYNSAVTVYTWPCASRCHWLPPAFARPIEQACSNVCTKP